jgi:predicted transcriptional regulator
VDKIRLTTKQELNIYMNPIRQQLLRQLNINKNPMTPKMLADKLNISASGVQHHIKKLMSLGLIERDHTEMINGITASFYKPIQVTVQIGLEQEDDTTQQRKVFMQNSLAKVYEGFCEQLAKRVEREEKAEADNLQQWGDILSGVVYLKEKESKELIKLIMTYIEQHASPSPDYIPWEFAMILYNAEELGDD